MRDPHVRGQGDEMNALHSARTRNTCPCLRRGSIVDYDDTVALGGEGGDEFVDTTGGVVGDDDCADPVIHARH